LIRIKSRSGGANRCWGASRLCPRHGAAIQSEPPIAQGHRFRTVADQGQSLAPLARAPIKPSRDMRTGAGQPL